MREYKRVAKQSGVDFVLSDSEAVAIMRSPCIMCGTEADTRGNSITRLANRDTNQHKGMGHYSASNTAPACKTCNLMKGYHRVESFVSICRTIATHKKLGDFGSFPECFANNTSKRNRSSYLTESKTHSLTNEEFTEIVSMPCYFCGKKSDPPRHYNGLDRLDSTKRVYKKGTCVSCCGTCNVAKFRLTESDFLEHCRKVAAFNIGTQSNMNDNLHMHSRVKIHP